MRHWLRRILWFDLADAARHARRKKRERAALVLRALDLLPDDQQRVVQLRFFEGRRMAEIAAELDRSEAAVAGLLFRGLRWMKRELPEC